MGYRAKPKVRTRPHNKPKRNNKPKQQKPKQQQPKQSTTSPTPAKASKVKGLRKWIGRLLGAGGLAAAGSLLGSLFGGDDETTAARLANSMPIGDADDFGSIGGGVNGGSGIDGATELANANTDSKAQSGLAAISKAQETSIHQLTQNARSIIDAFSDVDATPTEPTDIEIVAPPERNLHDIKKTPISPYIKGKATPTAIATIGQLIYDQSVTLYSGLEALKDNTSRILGELSKGNIITKEGSKTIAEVIHVSQEIENVKAKSNYQSDKIEESAAKQRAAIQKLADTKSHGANADVATKSNSAGQVSAINKISNAVDRAQGRLAEAQGNGIEGRSGGLLGNLLGLAGGLAGAGILGAGMLGGDETPEEIEEGSVGEADYHHTTGDLTREAAILGGATAASSLTGSAVKAAEKQVAKKATTTATTKATDKAVSKAETKATDKLSAKLGPKAFAKLNGKLAAKLAANSTAKRIPVLGLLTGGVFAAQRALKGDWAGAGMEFGSGATSLLHLADMFTGAGGTLAAVGAGYAIDGALLLRDHYRINSALDSGDIMKLRECGFEYGDIADIAMSMDPDNPLRKSFERRYPNFATLETDILDDATNWTGLFRTDKSQLKAIGSFIAASTLDEHPNKYAAEAINKYIPTTNNEESLKKLKRLKLGITGLAALDEKGLLPKASKDMIIGGNFDDWYNEDVDGDLDTSNFTIPESWKSTQLGSSTNHQLKLNSAEKIGKGAGSNFIDFSNLFGEFDPNIFNFGNIFSDEDEGWISNTSGPLTKITNAEQLSNARSLLNKFKTKLGLNDKQAIGMLGVLHAESGLNPAAENAWEKKRTKAYGEGIAQWSNDRKEDFAKWYAATIGNGFRSIHETPLDIQGDYLVYEFSHKYGPILEMMRKAGSLEDAVDIMRRGYENGDGRSLASIDMIRRTYSKNYPGRDAYYEGHSRRLSSANGLWDALIEGNSSSFGINPNYSSMLGINTPFNPFAAANRLQNDAFRSYRNDGYKSPTDGEGLCAAHVANALMAGGIRLNKQGSAYQYNDELPRVGFEEIPFDTVPQIGDVAVTDRTGTHLDGHIAMWDGERWVSDFAQTGIHVYPKNEGKIRKYRYPSVAQLLTTNNAQYALGSKVYTKPPAISPIESKAFVTPRAMATNRYIADLNSLAEKGTGTAESKGSNTNPDATPVVNAPTFRQGDTIVNNNQQYITNIHRDDAAQAELM